MYLVLTEKPSQAKEISKYMQNSKKEGRAFTGKFHGKDIAVLPLAGHILQITTDLSQHSDEFDAKDWKKGFDRLPYYPENSFYKRSVSRRDIYNEAKKWIAKCDKIIIATDPDIEGAALAYEVLMFNKALDKVIDYINMDNIVLVDKMLQDAINGKKNKNLDFLAMSYQGMLRADFNYGIGINVSRYLIVSTNSRTTFGTQQTRLLNEIAKRTADYKNFKTRHFYTIVLNTKYGDFTVELANEDDKFDKDKIIEIGKKLEMEKSIKVYSVERKEKEEKSLKWYDGSDVAQEASSALKISPLKLLDEKTGLLEHLYLKKIMTYPRGEAKGKMPLSQLELQKEIANAYKGVFGVEIDTNLVKKGLWYEDGKEKVNHTPYTIASADINLKDLSKEEKTVFDIVLKRLLSIFMPNPVSLTTKIKGKIGEYDVVLTEISDVKRGWREVYNMPVRECKTKDVSKDEVIEVENMKYTDNITKPQPLYTEKSIITLMKKKKIGTQATFGSLIELISSDKRPYIIKKKSQLIATDYANLFLSIIPDDAINILEEFEETIMNKLDSKEITLNEAYKRRNDLIDKTFNLIKKEINNPESIKKLQAVLETNSNKKEVIGKCPKCGKNLIDKGKSYVCEGVKWHKDGDKWENIGDCDFQIKKAVNTEKIKFTYTKKNIKDLLEKGKTKVDILFKKNNNKVKKDVIIKNGKTEILF